MFEIDLKSRQPLYEQIVDNIKQQIIKGVLQANEQLPSVRTLAAELTINPNTIQKAYRELERLGYVSSLPGRGSFVNEITNQVNEERVRAILESLKEPIGELVFLEVSSEEVKEFVDEIYIDKEDGYEAKN